MNTDQLIKDFEKSKNVDLFELKFILGKQREFDKKQIEKAFLTTELRGKLQQSLSEKEDFLKFLEDFENYFYKQDHTKVNIYPVGKKEAQLKKDIKKIKECLK